MAFKPPPLTEWDDAATARPLAQAALGEAPKWGWIAPLPKDHVEHWEVSEHLFRKGFGHQNCG